MTPQALLVELLGRVGSSQGNTVHINEDELSQWPSEAFNAMKSQKLIKKARPATSAVCPGCEDECVMPVHNLPAKQNTLSSFIVCDKRNDTNRVPVSVERLIQWQCNAELLSKFIAVNLGLRQSNRQRTRADLWEIGIATGEKRAQMLCLKINDELSLVAGNNSLPLAEFVDFHDGVYSFDVAMINRLVDASTTADERYTPSNGNREIRKQETEAIHEGWKKAYLNLKKIHPNMSDVWCSRKIAKMMDIAYGRSAETIRKNMKK